MLKTVKIGSNEYNMKSSAYTPLKYRMDYGTDLLKDIGRLNKLNNDISKLKTKAEKEEAWMSEFSGFLEMAYRIAYVMITEYDPGFKSYEDWLKGIDNVFSNENWILEVMECAMSTFRR